MSYQLIQPPSGTNGGGGLLLLIVVGAIVLGLFLGGAELLNPQKGAAEADRLRADTEQIRAENAYAQRLRDIEANKREQEAALELRAQQRRLARQDRVVEFAIKAGTIVLCLVVLALAGVGCYWLVAQVKAMEARRAAAAGQQPRQASTPLAPSGHHHDRSDGGRSRNSPGSVGTRSLAPTYDGLLGYVHRSFIETNGADESEPEEPEPHEAVYLALLNRIRIITAGANGRGKRALRPHIRGLYDVELRISPQTFDAFVGSLSGTQAGEPLAVQEPPPARSQRSTQQE